MTTKAHKQHKLMLTRTQSFNYGTLVGQMNDFSSPYAKNEILSGHL